MRPLKENLSYYHIESEIEADKKIGKLIFQWGFFGYGILNILWNKIYFEDNYYWKFKDSDLEQLFEDYSGEQLTFTLQNLKDCMDYKVKIKLFDEQLYKQGVLTSKGIQKRYILISVRRKKIKFITDYFLLNNLEESFNEDDCQEIQSKLHFTDKIGVNVTETELMLQKQGYGNNNGVNVTETELMLQKPSYGNNNGVNVAKVHLSTTNSNSNVNVNKNLNKNLNKNKNILSCCKDISIYLDETQKILQQQQKKDFSFSKFPFQEIRTKFEKIGWDKKIEPEKLIQILLNYWNKRNETAWKTNHNQDIVYLERDIKAWINREYEHESLPPPGISSQDYEKMVDEWAAQEFGN